MANNGSKLTLPLILGIPLLGVALTTLFYFFVTSYGVHLGTHNQGVLISPPKQISELSVHDRDGQPYVWNDGKGMWTFLVPGRASCDARCQKILYFVRQTHTAIGSESPRVKMVYLNLDARLEPDTGSLLAKEYSHFEVLDVDGTQARTWFSAQEPKLNIEQSANFYVIDPAGWVMMYYTDAQDYKAVIKDMKFLLKNS